ncbi:putative cytochrome P450 [Lophiostoma macrostomum CBS 122681]|uniref:Putative cytochrome P450 n=1 Tax=Lophiostoma macrostomum CBS 122681 TaxID=1314788 RepID=A0A6A6SM76_9PLEO|nr:putative cytochrome P450 [Lophiostoma macrostomum CBS 122681]
MAVIDFERARTLSLTQWAIVFVLGFLLFKLVAELIDPGLNLAGVPGPWYARWTNIILKYQGILGNKAPYVESLHRKYGPVVRISPTEVDVSSVTGAKRIHNYRQPFEKSDVYTHFLAANGIANLFNAIDVEYHARHRRLLSASMSESSMKAMEGIVQTKAELAMKRMAEEMEKRGAADVLKWWLFFTTDVVGECTFGDSFRMLEQGRKNQYIDDLERTAFFGGIRQTFPIVDTINKVVTLPLFKEVHIRAVRMQTYAEESIRRYRNMMTADPSNPKITFFTRLFNAEDKTLTFPEIVSNAGAFIVAGSDTTAHTLTYLVWAVCRDDVIRKKLANEVAGLKEKYHEEDLKALPYLNCVIQESLRLYPAAPSGLPRKVPAGGVEIDGYWMPAGLTVSTQAYSMHRNTEIFPNPESFNPSRWEKTTKDMKDSSMPFGGGSRTCIGIHLAEMELRRGAAHFFRTFPRARVSTAEGFSDADMRQVIYFLMYPRGKRCLIHCE